uniref:Uncharacterized protein n=1 Tax=Wuchereria bancrofti TaxID=6293 RepID=A0AAF5RTN9_WUCBA
MAIYYNGIDIFSELGWRRYYFPTARCQTLCCCCWPPYHCALVLSVIDTTIWFICLFIYLFYFTNCSNWIDFGIFLILLGFFICELFSTITLAVSYRGIILIIRAVNELFIYAIGTFVVIFMYTVYELFELYITRKYQNTLDTPPEFISVIRNRQD